MNYKKETSRINLKIGLIAVLFTLVVNAVSVFSLANSVKAIFKMTAQNNVVDDFASDPDFAVPTEENILEDEDNTAAFDFGDETVNEDFTTGTVDEAPEVDGTGGYDYSSDTSSSFDDSFVSPQSYDSASAAGVWINHIGATNYTIHTDLVNIDDFIFELSNFKSRACSAFETVETEGLLAWEDEVYLKSEELQAVSCGFGVNEQGELIAVLFLEDGSYETVEGLLLSDSTEATEDFSARVGSLIDSGDRVLSTQPPVLLTANTTPKTAFNMFDDITSASIPTSVLDWDIFYNQYESWYASLDSVDSIGLLTISVPEGNKFMALAYNDGGSLLSTTEFISEV